MGGVGKESEGGIECSSSAKSSLIESASLGEGVSGCCCCCLSDDVVDDGVFVDDPLLSFLLLLTGVEAPKEEGLFLLVEEVFFFTIFLVDNLIGNESIDSSPKRPKPYTLLPLTPP